MAAKRLLCVRSIVFSLLLALLTHSSWSQGRVISGKVTDVKDGSPVAGATVSAKGSSIATSTGRDGSFTIAVPPNINALVISSIGFGMREVPITGSNLEIGLASSSAASLNEVVIIGYGTARKKDLTGAVSVITEKDFVKGPIITPEQLIAGKVAGVQISSNSGQPGAGR